MANPALKFAGDPKPQPVRLVEFAPDVEPTTPGAILDCGNLYPSTKGYRSYPSLTKYSANALPSAALGTFSGLFGSTYIVVVGITNQIYMLDTASLLLTSQNIVGLSSTNRWRFDLYGNLLVAVNGTNSNQSYNGTTWSAQGGSPPIAGIVQASNYSLFLIPPNSRTWWSSLSATIWTPSIATQTVTDNLDETPGNITAAHKLRAGMALYKRNALHFGTFSGPPFFWDFRIVSSKVGAPGQEAVANLGDVQYFPGADDFYSFDGYSLSPIPNQLREWFFRMLDGALADLITARWDPQRNLVFWHFPSVNANPPGTLDSWVCYDRTTGKWSGDTSAVPIDMPIFAGVTTGQLTYSSFTTTYTTYGAIPLGFMYGDLRSRNVDISGAFRSSDHALYLYNGAPGSAFFTTNDFGDRHGFYTVSRLRPWFTIYPELGATLQPLSQKVPGNTPVTGASRAIRSDGWFNFFNTSRLQRFKITGASEFEVTGLEVESKFHGEQ